MNSMGMPGAVTSNPRATRARLRAYHERQKIPSWSYREPDGSAYRIQKSIRDMLVFSEQDVIKDPPFSRLDLLSCRPGADRRYGQDP